MGTRISGLKRERRVLIQAVTVADGLMAFDRSDHNAALPRRARLTTDYETFRSGLFAAADLPADPDETWNDFIVAGQTYRKHLIDLGAHDVDRCLYCRQPLQDPARDLLSRYSTYLEDKISADLRANDARLKEIQRQITSLECGELETFLKEVGSEEEKPDYFTQVKAVEGLRRTVAADLMSGKLVEVDPAELLHDSKAAIEAALKTVGANLVELETQQANRTKVLAEKQVDLLELKDAVELGRSWSLIEAQVENAKEADRLKTLRRPLSSLTRAVTELAKTASDQMINQSFDTLFLEECEALRARSMKLQFVGREGRAQRRKVMTGKHKPSKVLSEGEQKVLALADFLAEARLAGITAPVIFDDPVSSLDHRRVKEVSQRIAQLADDNQVIVFTHDILFATTLLAMFEKSKRCAYFQISDEKGKGRVDRATGPRIDSLNAIKGRVNRTIQDANQLNGEARGALVHTGYSHLRSWCEVFVEDEVLRGVTRRYRANVQMSTLTEINVGELNRILPKVVEVFDTACRYIDGHSQPLATLGVSPTLSGLEAHWAELQELKMVNEGKATG